MRTYLSTLPGEMYIHVSPTEYKWRAGQMHIFKTFYEYSLIKAGVIHCIGRVHQKVYYCSVSVLDHRLDTLNLINYGSCLEERLRPSNMSAGRGGGPAESGLKCQWSQNTLTEDVEHDGGHPDPGRVGRVLHLARERLAEVVLAELVLQRGHGLPPPLVALLRHVGLLPEELPVAQIPAQARRRVALPALAREGLDLGNMRVL